MILTRERVWSIGCSHVHLLVLIQMCCRGAAMAVRVQFVRSWCAPTDMHLQWLNPVPWSLNAQRLEDERAMESWHLLGGDSRVICSVVTGRGTLLFRPEIKIVAGPQDPSPFVCSRMARFCYTQIMERSWRLCLHYFLCGSSIHNDIPFISTPTSALWWASYSIGSSLPLF